MLPCFDCFSKQRVASLSLVPPKKNATWNCLGGRKGRGRKIDILDDLSEDGVWNLQVLFVSG
jgi:hypothetical protein